MLLRTKYHGEVKYKEEDVISFPKGLPGFEGLKKFILFSAEENDLFSILHSLENRDVGLIVLSPFKVCNEYEFKLGDNTLKELNINSREDVMVLNTVTLNSQIEKITVNLRAPIIINTKHKIGEQIILNDEKYKIKVPLFMEES